MSGLAERKAKDGKKLLVIAGIMWILVLFTWTQGYHGFHMRENGVPDLIILLLGFIFPFISLPFVIAGISTWSRRHTLTKDEKIDELESRLEKVEKEKSNSEKDFSTEEKKD